MFKIKTIGFHVKVSFASRPLSHLIRWYNRPDDITKEFWEEAIQFHGTFDGLKITNYVHGRAALIYFVRYIHDYMKS